MRGPDALAALADFLEATSRQRMQAVTRPLERAMARDVAKWFLAAGERMVRELAVLAGRFDQNAEQMQRKTTPAEEALREALSFADWAYLVDRVLHGARAELEEIIDVRTGTALLKAAETLLADFDVATQIRFTLADPRAVAWAEGRAAAQVTRINETTRERLNTLLTNAVRDGKGWQKTAREIEVMFEDFAGPPLFPSKKFRSRAEAVAAFEIGDAYEAGQWMASESLAGAGWDMQKKWLNAGDDRVRPAHRTNSGDGWVTMSAAFSGDGAERPPTDPGCRCTLLWRRAPA